MSGAGYPIGPQAYGKYGVYGVLVPYGTLNLTPTSPAQSFNEPLSLSQAKTFLGIPARSPAEPDEDEEIQAFISGAREIAEIGYGRDLVVKQWDLVYDYWPPTQIELRSPLVSVDLIQMRHNDGSYTQLAENADYVPDASKHPAIITTPWNQTWPSYTPWPTSSLLIRFTSGYPPSSAFWADRGARIKVGMRRLISDWYNNKLPFGAPVEELPYGVTACFGFGALNVPK